MRTLSESEKKIVKKLCADTQYFSDLFEKDFLKDLVIEITQDVILNNFQVRYLFRQTLQGDDSLINKKLMEATEQIVQTINLLTYLESEAYIYSYKPSHGTTVHGYIGLKTTIQDYRDDSSKFIGTQYPDKESRELIFEFTNLLFVSTEALKDYEKLGYRTREQVRHRQNLVVAWVAIALSTLLGLAGIIMSNC